MDAQFVLPPASPVPARPRTEVRHLVVFVPGFGGSELRDGAGHTVWGISRHAVGLPVRVAERLVPAYEDLADPDFSDGLRPGGLVGLGAPGLFRSLGYQNLVTSLFEKFALDRATTYLEFTYDWRRPIAVSAAELARRTAERLEVVRQRVNPRAQVILLGYSMGGLVARQYIEYEGGHEHCRKLVTLGSPYRGSLKALDFLLHGPKVKSVRMRGLIEAVRRLPSLYELLPMYPVVQDRRRPGRPGAPGGPAVPGAPQAPRRLADVVDVLPGLDPERVRNARAFLRALNTSERPGRTEPWVGFGHMTLQRAVLTAAGLRVDSADDDIPENHGRTGGDGTVPAVAASPLSHSEQYLTVREHNQTHPGFVAADESVALIMETLRRYLRDHDPVEDPSGLDSRLDLSTGSAGAGAQGQGPVVSLAVEDLYDGDEPVVVRGHRHGWPSELGLWFRLDGGLTRRVEAEADGSFVVDLGCLPEGAHRLDLLRDGSRRSFVSDAIEVL